MSQQRISHFEQKNKRIAKKVVVLMVRNLYHSKEAQTQKKFAQARGGNIPKHIIVVDDDQEIQEIISFVLDRHGFEVNAASGGQQLQQLLVSQLPDLIILDVMMPGMDGYQICHGLRGDPRTRHIPVMIMTAHAEEIYQRISIDLGAAQHITKPFHPLELAEKVVALLEQV